MQRFTKLLHLVPMSVLWSFRLARCALPKK